MKRLLFLLLLCLVLLVVLTAVLNAPRVAEANAHAQAAHALEAAAHAMQTQAAVTGLAVAGMLLLVALLAMALALVVGLFLWGMGNRGRLHTGRLAMASHAQGGRFGTQPLKQRRMQIHHAPHPQLPDSHAQLPVPRYDTDWETELDWSVWENTPWDIEEPF